MDEVANLLWYCYKQLLLLWLAEQGSYQLIEINYLINIIIFYFFSGFWEHVPGRIQMELRISAIFLLKIGGNMHDKKCAVIK
jgi:hypothetical protein